MTVATKFLSWQRTTIQPGKPWQATSPNLLLLHDALVARGAISMGRNGYVVRTIRGGTSWSSHAYGAAIDVRYPDQATKDELCDWMIAHSLELGLQRIHDYGLNRYWEAGRGWIGRAPGTGLKDSLHVEVHQDNWADMTPIADRLTGEPAAPPKYPGKALRLGSTGLNVKRVQEVVGVVVDGRFGPKTEAAVKTFQAANGLVVDGIVGPVTWKAMFDPNS